MTVPSKPGTGVQGIGGGIIDSWLMWWRFSETRMFLSPSAHGNVSLLGRARTQAAEERTHGPCRAGDTGNSPRPTRSNKLVKGFWPAAQARIATGGVAMFLRAKTDARLSRLAQTLPRKKSYIIVTGNARVSWTRGHSWSGCAGTTVTGVLTMPGAGSRSTGRNMP